MKKIINFLCILCIALLAFSSCTFLPQGLYDDDKTDSPQDSHISDGLEKKASDSGASNAYIMTMLEESLVLDKISNRFYLDVGENRVLLPSFYEPMFEIEFAGEFAALKYEALYQTPKHYKVRLMGKAVGEETLVIKSKRYESLSKTVTVKVFEYDDPLPEILDYIVFDSGESFALNYAGNLTVEVCDNSGGNGQFLYYEDGVLKSFQKRDGAAKLKISIISKPNKYKYVFAFAVSKISDSYYESYFEERKISEQNTLSHLEDKMFHFVKNREELFDIYFNFSNANVPNKLLTVDFDRYEVLFINNYHSSCSSIGTIYSGLEFNAENEEFIMKTYTYDGESSGGYHESIEFAVIPKEEIPDGFDTSLVNDYTHIFNRVYGWVN